MEDPCSKEEHSNKLKKIIRTNAAREFIVLLILVIGASFAIVYSNVQTYDSELTPRSGYKDTVDYILIYKGEPASGIRGYRPLVPWMARVVPDLPSSFFTENRQMDSNFNIAIKFGVINFLFLIAVCLALYFLQRELSLSYYLSLIGVVFFLTSQTVIRSAGLPMTDMAFLFFFTVALLAILRKNFLLLLAATAIGALAKELILLCIPLVLITPMSRRDKGTMLLATLPSLGVYILVRHLMHNSSPNDGYLNGEVLKFVGTQLRQFITMNGWVNLFWSFGPTWFLALYAIFSKDLPLVLKRWALLVPLVFIGIMLGAGNLSRSLFSAAPVMIALSAYGAKRILECERPLCEEAL